MEVTLIGAGCDGKLQLTQEAENALRQSQIIFGAERILSGLPSGCAQMVCEYLPEPILKSLKQNSNRVERACVVFSGDSGFYSGAKKCAERLQSEGIAVKVLPGISCVQTLAARLKEDWQNWKLCSAHGVACDPLAELMSGKDCFFLTGGSSTPNGICQELTEAGLGKLSVVIGEELCSAEEKTETMRAEEAARRTFAPLSVLLIRKAPLSPKTVPGIADEEFIRGNVPMTKRVVRASVLSAMKIRPEDVCWDIGAGTGSVSVELALQSRAVWTVEREEKAIGLIEKNREKFCAWNLRIVHAEAPEGLAELPTPDAVFIGGSGRKLPQILAAVAQRNPRARVCIAAIALETLQEAEQQLANFDYSVEVMQISVSSAKEVGDLHLLLAQNPVFLITGEKK